MRVNLESVNRFSARRLAYSAVFFSAFGGFMMGRAVFGYLSARQLFHWIDEALVGLAFLAYGVFWAVLLVRRENVGALPRDTPKKAGLVSPPH